jgi:hypothetical protein
MAYDPNDPTWAILTITKDGNVSVNKGLTEAEAIATRRSLEPLYDPRLNEYGKMTVSPSGYAGYLARGIAAGAPDPIFTRCEIIGPFDLDWKKPHIEEAAILNKQATGERNESGT